MARSVTVGEIIAEKYRVDHLLGTGGMGMVVAATHVQLGQRVAIKVLLPDAAESPSLVARFEREALAVVQLHSEHVAKVFDVGRLPDGSAYMVMEFLEGNDLSQELANRGRIPSGEAVKYILQACDAISEAHAIGITHRDIKPANLFLARWPMRPASLKVLDFGISKTHHFLEGGAKHLTRSTEVIGSPLYMSPEQLRAAKNVDARSDVWSLGATLYQLISGAPPFDGETIAELSANILVGSLIDVREREPNASIPEGLARVIARALEKEPDQRYQSAVDFANALRPFESTAELASGSISPFASTTPSIPAGPTSGGPMGEVSAAAFASTQHGSGSPTLTRPLLALTAAVVVLGAGGLFIARRTPEPPVAAPSLFAGPRPASDDPPLVPTEAPATPAASSSQLGALPVDAGAPSPAPVVRRDSPTRKVPVAASAVPSAVQTPHNPMKLNLE